MNVAQKFIDYLRSSKEEFKKVSWPSRRDTIRYSALVISACLVMAVFFVALDAGFSKLVDLMITARTAPSSVQATPQTAQPVTPAAPTAPAPTFDITNVKPITTPTK